jgi:replication-associated recombination protein RarA
MEKEFVELLKKKAAEQSKNPVDSKMIEAKKNVVQQIMDMLKGDMAGQMKGLKKVTVASNDEEGLKKGLNKAQEIIGSASEDAEPSEEMEEEIEESPMEESSESPDEEIAELEKKIAELKAKKMV